jgi:hypothetical protein
MFEQGLRHVDAEEWSLAADRFSRVLELRYSAVAAYNLALARARLGEGVRALEGLRELLAHPGLDASVRDAALALQREEEATVGWLTVRVRGDCAGCRVLLDSTPVPTASLSAPLPVNPGQHAVALVRGSQQLDTSNLTIARGARLEASLDANQLQAGVAGASVATKGERMTQSSATAPPGALARTDEDPKAPRSGSLLASPWFWGGVGVLAAGAVTLGVVLSSGGSESAAPVPGDFTPGVLSGEVKR